MAEGKAGGAGNGEEEVGALIRDGKALVCELCNGFYSLGWVSGTGGSISIKVTRTDTGDARAAEDGGAARRAARIAMAPSGVMKERMQTRDIFVLDGLGEVVHEPEANDREVPAAPGLSLLRNDAKRLRLSECAPLFLSAYHMRNAGAIIHSHAMCSVMATVLHADGGAGGGAAYDEFRVTEIEMIKGIKGHGFYDTLTVPIIENTAREYELTESLQRAMAAYPKTFAVLVRSHGVYIWGESWEQAKTHAECYHYLFEAAADMKKMGIDARVPRSANARGAPAANRFVSLSRGSPVASFMNGNGAGAGPRKRPRGAGGGVDAIVLDIEGTTTPITFVHEVLFPFARRHLERYLCEHWESPTFGAMRERLVELTIAEGDAEGDDCPRGRALKCLLRMMDEDRKAPALKELQGMIWEGGYGSGDLRGQVYEDVPLMLMKWTAAGVRVFIYSSGSIGAQKLLFANTEYGDLTRYLSGHFDTTTGGKRDAESYRKILREIGAARAVFVTDIHEEAVAAREAGMDVAVSVRPGNYELPEAHGWRTVTSMSEVLAGD